MHEPGTAPPLGAFKPAVPRICGSPRSGRHLHHTRNEGFKRGAGARVLMSHLHPGCDWPPAALESRGWVLFSGSLGGTQYVLAVALGRRIIDCINKRYHRIEAVGMGKLPVGAVGTSVHHAMAGVGRGAPAAALRQSAHRGRRVA